MSSEVGTMRSRSLHRLLFAATVGLAAMTSAAPAAPDCRCRYQGTFYELGQCVCIRVGGTTRRACCGKVLNNTSWSFGGKTCDLVRRDNSPRATPAPWSIAERATKPAIRRWQDIH
jgi:hypothetical protein